MTRSSATAAVLLLGALAAACQPAGRGGMTPGPAAVPVVVAAPTAPVPVPGFRSPDVPAAVPSAEPTRAESPAPAPSARPAEQGPWLAYGDSITHNAFLELGGWVAAFAPVRAPDVRNAGMPGANSRTALLRLDEVLAANPTAVHMGLAFGTNDAYSTIVPTEEFAGRMRLLVQRVEAAGKRPMLASVPWSPHAQMAIVPAYNAALAAIAADLGLPPGPDLYTWFEDHPEELNADGIHPTEAGSASIRRLWGEALRAGFETDWREATPRAARHR